MPPSRAHQQTKPSQALGLLVRHFEQRRVLRDAGLQVSRWLEPGSCAGRALMVALMARATIRQNPNGRTLMVALALMVRVRG